MSSLRHHGQSRTATNAQQRAACHVTLESKIAFLRLPTSYPEFAYRVDAIETHMSWVFLTDGYAYKLKKPVRQEFLDFSTIESRHYYCEEEVRLNRRLAAEVYLGVVPLMLNASGHLQLHAPGTPVDWLVKMRRLPSEHMLDYKIKHGVANQADICEIATRLTAFYQACQPINIDTVDYRDGFTLQIDSLSQELGSPGYNLPVDLVERICSTQEGILCNMSPMFDERIESGKIIEGHGDLRPEHICLNPDAIIIDCLEFSRALRIVDRVDELAFLALECERLGATHLGALLLEKYGEVSNDWPDASLIHFYQSYRAILRAAIAIRHISEEKFRYSPEWPSRARAYLQLAESHIKSCK